VKRRMKIVFDEGKLPISEHAQMIVRALGREDNKYPGRAKPLGVAHHTARFPIVCTDCGVTYWSRDEYASHIGCKGEPPKQSVGFQ
jgi:hypothetical protein